MDGGVLPTQHLTRSPPSLWFFITALLVVAFSLNWLWEMLQGSAYVELTRLPPAERLLTCTVAAGGDAVITLGVYAVGALAAGRLRWGMEGRWNIYTTAALLGGVWAAAIEWRALAFGHWSYTDRMPIVPVLDIGLWPLLQLTVLVPAAFWIAARWTLRSRR